MVSTSAIRELQQFALELSANNKITQKNSWELTLIDHIDEIVKGSQQPNFQEASCTLDASVKIYAHRVDSVHNQTYKVLGGFHSNRRDEFEDDKHEEDEGACDQDFQEEKKVPKKRTVTKKNTLVSSFDAINEKDINSPGPTPSIFMFSDSKRLWLDTLPLGKGCSLDLERRVEIEQTKSSPVVFDISDIQQSVADVSEIQRTRWGPGYQKMYDLAKEDFKGGEESFADSNDMFKDLLDPENVAELRKKDQEEWEEKKDFFSNAEDDFGFSLDDDDKSETQDAVTTRSKIVSFDSDETSPMMLLQQAQSHGLDHLDYVPSIDWHKKLSHWKFLEDNKTTKRNDSKAKKRSKVQEPKKSSKIDFEHFPEEVKDLSHLRTKGENITKKTQSSLVFLPETAYLDCSYLSKSFIKPNLTFGVPFVSSDFDNRSLAVDGYSASTRDAFEYSQDDDMGKGFSLVEHPSDTGMSNQPSLNTDFDLVAAPALAAKSTIGFSKIAKRVDVKTLKSAIWGTVCEIGNKTGFASFQEVVQQTAIRVSKESRKDITLPFYFICALHLCNEQNLEIEPSCFLGDFKLVSSRK